ncbi:MAG: thiaminase II [Stappiaceae bacterium]
MKLFDRLKKDAGYRWTDYVEHEFVQNVGNGGLSKESFRHYLIQDYLFLVEFARAYALAIYKSPDVRHMNTALLGVKAILEVELDLHVELCGKWGMSREDLETSEEASANIAYTRFVLEAGMRGDLLDLLVALAPCIVGYAEIGAELSRQTNPGGGIPHYQRWIAEYAGDDYQNLTGAFGEWMDDVAETYLSENRYPHILETFNRACRLESDFWQMGLDRSI